jgi:hypothetical protein
MSRYLTASGVLLVALALAVQPASAAGTVQRTAVQGRFKLQLTIGPAERMSMGRSTSGEKMLGGPMATCKFAGSMNMGRNACNHHVELNVHTVAGQLVSTGHVSITIQNAEGRVIMHVPVARMQGVMTGKRDIHFGNNVHLAAGSYTITVKVNVVRHIFTGIKLGT